MPADASRSAAGRPVSTVLRLLTGARFPLSRSFAATPKGNRPAVSVIIELNPSRRVHLGEEDYLAGVHGEMLHYVEDRRQSGCLTTLDGESAAKIGLTQAGQNAIGIPQNGLEFRHEGVDARPIASRELGRPVAAHRHFTDSANYPLANIARQVDDEIADAVGVLVRAVPDGRGWKVAHGESKLGGILMAEVVAGPLQKR